MKTHLFKIFLSTFFNCFIIINTQKQLAFGLIFLLGVGLASSDPTGSPGSDETDLATSAGASFDGRRFTDVLVVTTTMRMLHGVHSNTTNLKWKISFSH